MAAGLCDSLGVFQLTHVALPRKHCMAALCWRQFDLRGLQPNLYPAAAGAAAGGAVGRYKGKLDCEETVQQMKDCLRKYKLSPFSPQL
jgi:hypothetical protein